MKQIRQSASIMCVDFFKLEAEIKILETYGVDYLHIDIMDGHFVPNIALGSDFCRQLRQASSIPLDMHFMVENIDRFLQFFNLEGSLVSFHPETSLHPLRTIDFIREQGGKPGIAIDPAYHWNQYEYLYGALDFVLIMSVSPGYAGQKLIPSALQKTRQLRDYLDSNGMQHIPIEIDGNVSWENIPVMVESGTEILVTGTSSVFSRDLPREETFTRFNALKEQLQQ